MAKSGTTDSGRGRGGSDDPVDHDANDDKGGTQPGGSDDPADHDIGDDHGVDDPLTHDIGDDHGVDDPLTHDVGDDHGVHDPLTHDVGDDHGGDRLKLVLNERTGQWIFTDDEAEHDDWLDDHGRDGLEVELRTPKAGDETVSVWRFHDEASDVYFWTTNTALKDDLLKSHPELSFDGEAFRAYADDQSGGSKAIGVVWDQAAGPYGNFIYAEAEDAVKLAGQSDTDALVYLGVAFWI